MYRRGGSVASARLADEHSRLRIPTHSLRGHFSSPIPARGQIIFPIISLNERTSVFSKRSWYGPQPGGLSEISRGVRHTAERRDDTPDSGRGVRDPGRVAADLASRWDAVGFPRQPGVSLPQVAQPPANFSHRSAMPPHDDLGEVQATEMRPSPNELFRLLKGAGQPPLSDPGLSFWAERSCAVWLKLWLRLGD